MTILVYPHWGNGCYGRTRSSRYRAREKERRMVYNCFLPGCSVTRDSPSSTIFFQSSLRVSSLRFATASFTLLLHRSYTLQLIFLRIR